MKVYFTFHFHSYSGEATTGDTEIYENELIVKVKSNSFRLGNEYKKPHILLLLSLGVHGHMCNGDQHLEN